MDTSRANICSTVAAAAVALFMAANAVQGEDGHRVGRSDVRSVLGEKMDPNFWPTRGRRSPVGGSDEESEAPFWANRGRSVRLGDLQTLLQERAESEEDPPFWANRGRSLPCEGIGQEGSSLFAEEPYWVMMDRRDDDAASTLVDPFWVARGRRGLLDTIGTAPNDFWAVRGKKAGRQGESAATRALGLNTDQFWPARGKRAATHTHDRRGKDKPQHDV